MGRMKDLAIEMEEKGMNGHEEIHSRLQEEIQAIAKKAIASPGVFKGRPRRVWSSIASHAMRKVSLFDNEVDEDEDEDEDEDNEVEVDE